MLGGEVGAAGEGAYIETRCETSSLRARIKSQIAKIACPLAPLQLITVRRVLRHSGTVGAERDKSRRGCEVGDKVCDGALHSKARNL